MTPGASGTHRQIVMEATGLKPGQIMDICDHIEAKFGKGFIKMQILSQAQAKFPRGGNLTSAYGRSNRISKMVGAQSSVKQPVKNLDGFLGLNKQQQQQE